MDTLECIRTCVAVREFLEDPVPREILKVILEAARWSPSSKNSQPWHFIVIEDRDTLEKLSRLTPTGPHLAKAPVGIAVATIGAKMPYVDAARAVQNMVLTAWDQGLGTCWIANYQEEEAKRLLGLPEEAAFITAMPYGFPTPGVKGRRKRRKPLDEIVHWERFGSRRPL